jgi:hypothetical protein
MAAFCDLRLCFGDGVEEFQESLREGMRDFVSPLQDKVFRVDLEDIGGMLDPECTLDFFTRKCGTAQFKAYNRVGPSEATMRRARDALVSLITEDPSAGEPRWLREYGLMPYEPTRDMAGASRLWCRCDAEGEMYFGLIRIPGDPAWAARHMWREEAMRHCVCTDDAPRLQLCELGNDARMEYQVSPASHPLSNLSSDGLDFDSREAIVLAHRETVRLRMDGREVTGYLIWQKSCDHPKYPSDQVAGGALFGSRSTNNFRRPAYESQYRTKSRAMNKAQELPPPEALRRGLTRQKVFLRAFLIVPTQMGTMACVFGHENPGGMYSTFGKIGFMMSAGAIHGGVPHRVLHMFRRLCDIHDPGYRTMYHHWTHHDQGPGRSLVDYDHGNGGRSSRSGRQYSSRAGGPGSPGRSYAYDMPSQSQYNMQSQSRYNMQSQSRYNMQDDYGDSIPDRAPYGSSAQRSSSGRGRSPGRSGLDQSNVFSRTPRRQL